VAKPKQRDLMRQARSVLREADSPGSCIKSRASARPLSILARRWKRNEEFRPPVAQRRALRKRLTEAEWRLWQALKGRQIEGAKVRRQHAVGPYVLDFYYPSHRLAVEVDGSGHVTADGRTQDAARTTYLEERGLRVIRFTNVEVLSALEAVLDCIVAALNDPSPPPSPRAGRGSEHSQG
jgi:very-short-patch-repair endonuclease